MTARVLMLGSEQLTMAQADRIATVFKRQGASIMRQNLSQIRWGEFCSALQGASHVLLILSKACHAAAKRNVEEVVKLVDLMSEDTRPRMSALFLDDVSVTEYSWLLAENHVTLAFASNPFLIGKMPQVRNRVLIGNLIEVAPVLLFVQEIIGENSLTAA